MFNVKTREQQVGYVYDTRYTHVAKVYNDLLVGKPTTTDILELCNCVCRDIKTKVHSSKYSAVSHDIISVISKILTSHTHSYKRYGSKNNLYTLVFSDRRIGVVAITDSSVTTDHYVVENARYSKHTFDIASLYGLKTTIEVIDTIFDFAELLANWIHVHHYTAKNVIYSSEQGGYVELVVSPSCKNEADIHTAQLLIDKLIVGDIKYSINTIKNNIDVLPVLNLY